MRNPLIRLAFSAAMMMTGTAHLYGDESIVEEPGSGTILKSEPVDKVEAAFARGKKLLPSLEKIRGISFKRDVVMEVQSHDDFAAHLRKEIARQYGQDGGKAVMDALTRLGFLEESLDLGDAMIDLMKSQAAAHYSPKDNAYYLLMPDMPPLMLDMISAHELFHALQDQHFDLHKFVMADVEAIQDNGDAASAKQALVEGEATFVMTLHSVIAMTGMPLKSALPFVSQQILMQGSMTYDEMLASLKQQAGMMKQFGMEESAKDIDDLPRYFVESMQALYLKGGAMVQHVYAKQGWEGIDALYRNPPDSMEQILHPEKLIGERDMPVDVRLPNFIKHATKAGWVLLEEDVAGELGIFSYLDMWRKADNIPLAKRSAAGWGGDRYYYLSNKASKEAGLIWRTVWDSEDDAVEFAAALKDSLKQRFEGLEAVPGKEGVWSHKGTRFLRVSLDVEKRQVDLLDADSLKTLTFFFEKL